jgi:photosystem II stability/assembly factor-like uncharacterized protein
VNGFDFDGLRDHLAPTPGRRERDAVQARARELRARSRRNRLAVSSISLVAVLAVVAGIVASQRDDTQSRLVVEGGPPPTSTTVPTTTTTAPAAPTSTTLVPVSAGDAVSASWVSPDHGWVLEADGTVAETLDGGHTWRRMGTTIAPKGGKIRFADASHGYQLDAASIYATDDGGAHWVLMHTPIGAELFDLVVANGVVYVAAGNSNAQVVVWTAPVGGDHWTERETGIPIGAGPIPHTQLVFTGDAGWLLQVDRTVVGGAKLTGAVKWTPWTPPCADTGGGAYLAASSPDDLVASCTEGVWTGPSIKNGVYFSHDGGQTFTRQGAPNSGAVAMANTTTAIVPGQQGMQRTTDSGATWQGVFDSPLTAADLGFTTATQGFVIFTNGEMLMTYDGGATWQPVTLP